MLQGMSGKKSELKRLKRRWPAALGALLVLLGFVDQKLLIDRSTEAKQTLDAANQADIIEEYALQASAIEVVRSTAAAALGINPEAIEKARVVSALSGKFYLINAQRRIADSLVDAMPFTAPDLTSFRSTLKSKVECEEKDYKAYLYGVSASSTDLDLNAVNNALNRYTKLIEDSQTYNHMAQAEAEKQLKQERGRISLETGAQYALFGFGWLLAFVFKLQVRGLGWMCLVQLSSPANRPSFTRYRSLWGVHTAHYWGPFTRRAGISCSQISGVRVLMPARSIRLVSRLSLAFLAVVLAIPAHPAEQPNWAKGAIPFDLSCSPSLHPIISPDRRSSVEVICRTQEHHDPAYLLRIRTAAGRSYEVPLQERAQQLLWAPDSRAFL